jgi:hypothetical protein
MLNQYRDHLGKVMSITWSPDGRHIVSSGEDNIVAI